MIFSPKAWLQGRRMAMDDQDWRNGYDWAAGAILRGEETAETVIQKTEFDCTHPFDRGARSAAYRVQQLLKEGQNCEH